MPGFALLVLLAMATPGTQLHYSPEIFHAMANDEFNLDARCTWNVLTAQDDGKTIQIVARSNCRNGEGWVRFVNDGEESAVQVVRYKDGAPFWQNRPPG